MSQTFIIEGPLQTSNGLETVEAQSGSVSDWVNSTFGSQTGYQAFVAYDASASREGFRVSSNGSAPEISFFGGSPAAKPTVTGSKGSNAALTSLLAGLVALGLVTDSTS
jgi:hypothetical protein